MTRFPDWESRLHDFLVSREHTPFRYGVNDCCLFAADAVCVITGVDIAAEFRGQYKSQRGALTAIKRLTGGTTAADAVAYAARDLEECAPALARRGDLVLVEEGELIAGIVHLSGTDVVVAGRDGLLRKPFTDIKRAWHAGS